MQKEVLNTQRGSNVIVYLFQWGSACRSKGTLRKSSKAPISETFKCVKEGQLRHPMHFWIIKFGVFATDHFEMWLYGLFSPKGAKNGTSLLPNNNGQKPRFLTCSYVYVDYMTPPSGQIYGLQIPASWKKLAYKWGFGRFINWRVVNKPYRVVCLFKIELLCCIQLSKMMVTFVEWICILKAK